MIQPLRVPLEVAPGTAGALAELAASHGLSVDEYLRAHVIGEEWPAPLDDVDAWFDEISEGMEGVPPLPPDFSIEDIYMDHD